MQRPWGHVPAGLLEQQGKEARERSRGGSQTDHGGQATVATGACRATGRTCLSDWEGVALRDFEGEGLLCDVCVRELSQLAAFGDWATGEDTWLHESS